MKNNVYSLEIKKTVEDFLIDSTMSYAFNYNEGVFMVFLNSSSDMQLLPLRIQILHYGFVVYTEAATSIFIHDDSTLQEVMCLTCLLNQDLIMGNFELSHKNIRFKVFHNCDNTSLSKEVVQDTIYLSILMMQRYLPLVSCVILKELSLNQASIFCGVQDYEHDNGNSFLKNGAGR